MIFLEIQDLCPGMTIVRDIHYFDSSLNRAIEIKRSTRLSELLIEQLTNCKIDGAYVDEALGDVAIPHTITEEIKTEAINGIKNIAENFTTTPDLVQRKQLYEMGQTASSMAHSLSRNKNVMSNIFDLKMYDDYTFYHSLSVTVISLSIGTEMGLTRDYLEDLAMAALLHDVGKVTVPIEIITKPSRLTPQEFQIVKAHPLTAGMHFLRNSLVSADVYKGIVSHHEKWDGSGYPNGLTKEHIPQFGRILAVSDVYDALTSNRPYRMPLQPSEAIEYIMGGVGTSFDEDVVRAFLKKIAPYPVGMHVNLSNNEVAVVVKNYPLQPLRPVVFVTLTGEVYDLYNDMKYLNITIISCIASDDMHLTAPINRKKIVRPEDAVPAGLC